MNVKKLSALSLSVLSLISCGNYKQPQLKDYVSEIEMKDENFKILQMTDIHWNLITDLKSETKYIEGLVKHVNPNLIMITGDSFLIGNKNLANYFFSMIDELNIPYALTWGNHDEEGEYTKDYLSRLAARGKNSLYKYVKDDVFGDSNYLINIKKNNEVFYQIYSIDSNTNLYDSKDGYLYDYIRDDQVDWFKNEAESYKTSKGYVPSIAYFHIPLWEWAYAYYGNNSKKGTYVTGSIEEESTYTLPGLNVDKSDDENEKNVIKIWPGREHSKFFNEAKERGVKAMFSGHDHSNNLVQQYEDVTIGYGVKTGRGLYYYGKKDSTDEKKVEYDRTGGSVITIKSDKTYSLTHVFLDSDSVYQNDDESKYSFIENKFDFDIDNKLVK